MTDIRGFLTDENAVSPVIGVVLMVAVTVILSAAVGAFVLDIGNAVTEAQPQTAIDFQYEPMSGSSDRLTVTHGGGDKLDPAQITITIGGTEAWHDGTTTSDFAIVSSAWGDGVTSGESLVLEEDSSGSIDSGMTVQVVWTKGQQSSILASDEI